MNNADRTMQLQYEQRAPARKRARLEVWDTRGYFAFVIVKRGTWLVWNTNSRELSTLIS